MTWQQKLATKILQKYFNPIIKQNRIMKIELRLNYTEQKKFIKFGENFMATALTIATYISYILISFYLLKKIGYQKTTLLLAVMMIARLTNLTDQLKQ